MRYEQDKMREKLDQLWASKEKEVEHCRLITRYEADKQNQAEVERLCTQVSLLEEKLKLSEAETLAAKQEVVFLQSLP